ncbi:hypothetical protein CKM354_000985500 [Cercospora kikuchii]|uniref:JmjC domain-containing protein n=1 Tax=Cercospora kikuchii TaxID=84275 RepID=A0A9P3FJE4_9PEZI|nr:uncharacterized protein CKM354_000985500 [Cercospora kikuchii]GIZ46742.1 hypothetical protein CKM354_000985500 [Cercospora kikuchii]
MAQADEREHQDVVLNLIDTYHELNACVIDELTAQPTALQFARYVGRNRPFVVRRGACSWRAVRQWDASYLREVMGDAAVNVATTPRGNADGLVEDKYENLILVEPYEQKESFSDFLGYVQAEAHMSEQERSGRNVKYAQTQNDNLRAEYSALFADVPNSIDFASTALDAEPDAVNFWLGNERSVTALHKDNYENVYVQVRGEKHFVLLPPIEMPCVNEVPIQFARYQPTGDDQSTLEPQAYEDSELVPTPIWDPDEPDARASLYSKSSKPMRVTLYEGDMMYLPAMWYHKVSQSSGEEGYSCSVNYWYDMDFSGSFWAQNNYLRETVEAAAKQVKYPELSFGEEE